MMHGERFLQISIAVIVAAVLLIPGGIFTLGQVLPDNEAPIVTITFPTHGASLNNANVTITGTATDNIGVTSVEIMLDNISQGNAFLNNTSWTSVLTLAEGSHIITAIATDEANNTDTASSSFIIDTTPPSIRILSPANNVTLTTTDVMLNGTASDTNGITSVVVSIDNGSTRTATFNATTGIWTFQTTLANGTHSIKATATDMAGNQAMASTSVHVQTSTVADTTIPSINITSVNVNAIVNGTVANDFNVTISGTASDDNGLASVQIKIDNGAFVNAIGTTSWSFSTTLNSGTHTITAKATDNAENMNIKSITLTLQTTVLINQPPAENQLPQGNQTQVPPPVQEDMFSCNGHTINGKVELEGANATFIDCEIRGTVRIKDSTAEFKNTSIRGNLKVEDSDLTFISSELRGNLHMEGGSLILEYNVIRGNVKVCETAMTEVENNIVKGNIEFCGEGEDEEADEHDEEDSISGSSHTKSSSSSHGKGNDVGKGNSDKDKGANKHDKDDGKGKGNNAGKGNSKNKKKDKDDD